MVVQTFLDYFKLIIVICAQQRQSRCDPLNMAFVKRSSNEGDYPMAMCTHRFIGDEQTRRQDEQRARKTHHSPSAEGWDLGGAAYCTAVTVASPAPAALTVPRLEWTGPHCVPLGRVGFIFGCKLRTPLLDGSCGFTLPMCGLVHSSRA